MYQVEAYIRKSCCLGAGTYVQVTRWYRLLDEDELYDEEDPLGEIELSVQWLHDPRAKDIATRKLSLIEIVQRTLGKCIYLGHACRGVIARQYVCDVAHSLRTYFFSKSIFV